MATTVQKQLSDFGDMPLNRFIKRLTVLSAMGVFLDGYDLTIISVALLFITPQFHPSAIELSMVGAAAVVGMFFGALVLGNLTDRFGRKIMYMLDLVFFVVFALLAAVAQNMTELIIFRFLLGLGLGADYPISSTITAEFAPKMKRGILMVTTIAFWTIGAIVSYAVSLALLHTGPEAWRWMLATGAIPAIAVIIGRRSIPESPRWLMASGQTEKGLEVAKKVVSDAGGVLDTANNAGMEKPVSKMAAFGRLFRKDLIKMTLFVGFAWLIYDIGNYATIVFTPTILNMLKGSTMTSAVAGSLIMQLFGLVGIAVVWLLVDKLGRKWIQTIGFLLVGLVFLVMGIVPKPTFIIFMILYILYIIVTQGPGQITYVYAGEVFPTSVRASGHGFATAMSRIGAALGIGVVPFFMAHVGLQAALITFGVVDLIGFGLTWVLAPETKGRALPAENDIPTPALAPTGK